MAMIRYTEGFPTHVDLPRLNHMLRVLGAPDKIVRRGRTIYIEWPPIFPGVPIPSHSIMEPFADSKGRIPIASITLD